MLPANSENLTSSLPKWTSLIYFSCHIGVARTFSTILNNSGESERPCFFPIVKEKWSGFSH